MFMVMGSYFKSPGTCRYGLASGTLPRRGMGDEDRRVLAVVLCTGLSWTHDRSRGSASRPGCRTPALAKFPAEVSSTPGLSTGGPRREIAHHDLLRHRVQHGAAQLPAIARVAGLAGRAGIDHQHPADATDDLAMRMAVEHDVGVSLAKAVQPGAGWQNVAAARLPWRRVH